MRESSTMFGRCAKEGNRCNSEENRLFKGYRYFKGERKAKKTQIETVRNYLKATDKTALDGTKWKCMIHITNTVNWD